MDIQTLLNSVKMQNFLSFFTNKSEAFCKVQKSSPRKNCTSEFAKHFRVLETGQTCNLV